MSSCTRKKDAPIDRQSDTKLYHTINIIDQSRCLAMHLSPVILYTLSVLPCQWTLVYLVD